ncbi:hypothetical protein KJ909_00525 [Patescibacteria group bacterium]|nr:hypothetical protein [Patescibacteria group bacterium]
MVIFFLLFLFIHFTSPIVAISPSPTPDNSQTETNENIQKIRQAVEEKVKEKLASITTSVSSGKKGFVGDIRQIDQNQITINFRNQDFLLKVNQDTVFIDEKRNKTNLDKLSEGQSILAMGYLEDGSPILNTKRLIILPSESFQPKQHIIIGNIADISLSSSVLVLIPLNNKDLQYQIKTDNKTKILTSDLKTGKIANLENGQKIIAIFSPTDTNNKTYYAHKIIQITASPTPTPEDL